MGDWDDMPDFIVRWEEIRREEDERKLPTGTLDRIVNGEGSDEDQQD